MTKKTWFAAALLVAGCYGGVNDSSDFEGAEFTLDETQEIIDNLKLAGYPDSENQILEDGTVFVGGDAVVTLQASREMAAVPKDGQDFRQYHTTNLVDTGGPGYVICINPTASFDSYPNLSAGLDMAIARYNAENLQISMQRNGGGCNWNITADTDGSGGGVAGFPSGGNPYHEFFIGTVVDGYGSDVASHVIGHELGHCIGFRHTDYFNRSISCGSGGNEGSAGVGAIHIPGTPTTNVTSTTSIMNSCYSLSSTGVFTSSDQVALSYLYDGGYVPPNWTEIDTHANQSAGNGVETQYGPYDATGYNAMRFTISGGGGDADLYVRHGAAPTTGSYDCRPYLAGNNETCEFNPSENGLYYVMVRAYSAYNGVTLTVEGEGDPPPAEICDNGIDDDADGDTDCADSDCAADPACAPPDPEICDNGIDDDGDLDTDCDDSDCAGDPACAPDPEICDDGIDNDGDGDTDCADSDCTGDPACAPPGGWVELMNDNFDSGWGNWNDGGSDVRRSANDSNYANSGQYCVRLRDNSGNASATTSDDFSLSGYSQLRVSFSFWPRSMENGEDFFIELWDGNSWEVIGNYARGTDFNNNTRYNWDVTVDSGTVNFSSAAALRFRNDASGNSDWIYLDDVVVEAQ